MNREEAIQWCKDNKCNFIEPVFPPPQDWMWAENGENEICLIVIFTSEDYADIEKKDALP